MRMYDIIAAKRDGKELSANEIEYAVQSFTRGDTPDYQMSAFLMAVFLQGMTAEETALLTASMARSGDQVDLSSIQGVTADKHSTGGVGDKTTLITAPLAAACGAKIAKMSGRGLGHTGGTLDKLEAIPGFCTDLSPEAFFSQVNTIGLAVVGQSGNLAPADKKMYALRDVTATVNSLPLIASSIMSKKLAAGADAILLDVKTGSGAFMKSLEDSLALARAMVDIGARNGRSTAALITDMDRPLGRNIGNSLEVCEAVETLLGKGPADLTEVCLQLTAGMLSLAGLGSREACYQKASAALTDGSGFAMLCRMVEAQGGDVAYIQDLSRFPQAPLVREVHAREDGFICFMDTEKIGTASVLLGAGREKKEDAIDPSSGICLLAKTGDFVRQGQPLALLHTATEQKADAAQQLFEEALTMAEQPPAERPLLYAYVDQQGSSLLSR